MQRPEKMEIVQPKPSPLISELVKQNRIILEVNVELLKALAYPPMVVSRGLVERIEVEK